MRKNTKNEVTAKPPFFVASTAWAARTPKLWVKTKAISIDGAKRIAAKLPRHLTATVEVAVANDQGKFETIATLEDCSAITRRRPTWRTHERKTGQALVSASATHWRFGSLAGQLTGVFTKPAKKPKPKKKKTP
jgi:hypothetical protein